MMALSTPNWVITRHISRFDRGSIPVDGSIYSYKKKELSCYVLFLPFSSHTIKEHKRWISNHGNCKTQLPLVAPTITSRDPICQMFHIENSQKGSDRFGNVRFVKALDACVEGELLAASEGVNECVELRTPAKVSKGIPNYK